MRPNHTLFEFNGLYSTKSIVLSYVITSKNTEKVNLNEYGQGNLLHVCGNVYWQGNSLHVCGNLNEYGQGNSLHVCGNLNEYGQ